MINWTNKSIYLMYHVTCIIFPIASIFATHFKFSDVVLYVVEKSFDEIVLDFVNNYSSITSNAPLLVFTFRFVVISRVIPDYSGEFFLISTF